MIQVGLHLRITQSLQEVVKKAIDFNLPFFQCFFLIQNINKLLQPTQQEIIDFVAARRQHFHQLYAHSSYLINLARTDQTTHYALHNELYLAQALEFTHLVIHPGSIKKTETKDQGIEAVARALNKANKHYANITILLENTAHGNTTIGNTIEDLAQIYAKLDKPERVGICLDTAHAHVYGYDIVTAQGRNQFITLVDNLIGIQHVALLHINDTFEKFGSKLDRHQLLGQGTLGSDVLRSFATDPRLVHIPSLIEPPVVNEKEEYEQLILIRSWYHKEGIK